jgi:hypothetical protein
VLVVPIIRGLDPYGFVGKYQGLSANGKSIEQVAKELFMIIANSNVTRSRITSCLIELLLRGQTESDILNKIEIIDSLSDFPISQLDRLREEANKNSIINGSDEIKRKLNRLMKSRGKSEILEYEDSGFPFFPEDDIPF